MQDIYGGLLGEMRDSAEPTKLSVKTHDKLLVPVSKASKKLSEYRPLSNDIVHEHRICQAGTVQEYKLELVIELMNEEIEGMT